MWMAYQGERAVGRRLLACARAFVAKLGKHPCAKIAWGGSPLVAIDARWTTP